MAAPGSEKTDLTSDNFDPAVALTEDVELPYPDIKPFNNLDEYVSFVTGKKVSHKKPPSADEKQESVKPKTSTSAENDPQPEESAPVRPTKVYHNVLTKMEKSYTKGPLGVLYRCVQERIKVKVWTRNYTEIRGICTGYIVAFDKHWNLAMADVDEVYLKPRKHKVPVYGTGASLSDSCSSSSQFNEEDKTEIVKRDPAPTKELQSLDIGAKSKPDRSWRRRRYDPCHRHVGQLFIRGDNVVIVGLVYL